MSEVTFSYYFSKFTTFDIKFHYMPTNGMYGGWKKSDWDTFISFCKDARAGTLKYGKMSE